jgi:glutathione S-transferase
MSKIKFWFAPGACSLAPHILLYEIGAHFEAIPVRITETRAFLPADFQRKINPKGRVPVITIDGFIITELPAIVTVIANLAPEKLLLGKDALEVAQAYEWMNWLSGTLHGQGFGGLWRPNRFSDDESAFKAIRAKAREVIAHGFDYIEERLSGLYAVGNAFTAVDTYLYVFYRWGNTVGFDMRGKYPRYTSLVSNLLHRPAVKAVLAEERIDAEI